MNATISHLFNVIAGAGIGLWKSSGAKAHFEFPYFSSMNLPRLMAAAGAVIGGWLFSSISVYLKLNGYSYTDAFFTSPSDVAETSFKHQALHAISNTGTTPISTVLGSYLGACAGQFVGRLMDESMNRQLNEKPNPSL